MQDEQIEAIVTRSINIIDLEIANIQTRQDQGALSKDDVGKVIDFLKTLIIIQKEKRQIAKDEEVDFNDLPKDEMDLLIAKEAAKEAAREAARLKEADGK